MCLKRAFGSLALTKLSPADFRFLMSHKQVKITLDLIQLTRNKTALIQHKNTEPQRKCLEHFMELGAINNCLINWCIKTIR